MKRIRSPFLYTLFFYHGEIVVRILHHVGQVHDGCIVVAMRLFGEKAAWVHQAHDAETLKLFYMGGIAQRNLGWRER